MTREEAIANLKMIRVAFVDPGTKEQRKLVDDTFDMAIQVLENHDTFMKYAYSQGKHDALSQEPTEKPMCDRNICISNEYNGIGCDECIVNKVEQEPCDDAISRQDAIDAIYEHEFSNWCDKDEVSTILNDLPPVTQKSETVTEFADRCRECGARYGKLLEQKSGKWITLENRFELGNRVKCSECGQVFVTGDSVSRKYCPNCGCRMVEPQESEV